MNIVGEVKSALGMWASVGDPKPARVCLCEIDDKLRVKKTKDPDYDPLTGTDDGYVKMKIDPTGEHYGWALEKPLKDGFSERTDRFGAEVSVCADPQDDTTHFNTIAPSPWELIKLDCGYWGSYYRDRTVKDLNQSRDFGMIVGQDVWLCRFHADVDDESTLGALHKHMDTLPPDAPGQSSPARKFMALCKERGFAVQLVSHAVAHASVLTEGLDDTVLRILLPDLHLPERWADEPATTDDPSINQVRFLHPDDEARAAMQWRLIALQHTPGRLWGNPLSESDQAQLQSHIERLLVDVDFSAVYEADGFKFNRHQFLAELSYVERRIRAGSVWFYKPAAGYAPLKSARGQLAAGADVGLATKILTAAGGGAAAAAAAAYGIGTYLKGNHYTGSASTAQSTPEPSPAIDMLNFLGVLRDLKEKGTKVELFQLGDLFELWMGREFLYFDCPPTDKPLEGFAGAILTGSKYFVLDKYQVRSDAGWRFPEDPGVQGCKRFAFDPADEDRLKVRYMTGSNTMYRSAVDRKKFHREAGRAWTANRLHMSSGLSDPELESLGERVLARAKRLLDDRIANVAAFSGPLTLTASSSRSWAALKLHQSSLVEEITLPPSRGGASTELRWSEAFRVRRTEYAWNRGILRLLTDLNAQFIHGNHDGYRSDPLLSSSYASQEVLSLPGLWLEHIHRFDEYNRDGRAFGAGVTNLVYYFMDDMLTLDKAKELVPGKWYHSAEREANIPGAAQWFLITNLAHFPAKKRLERRGIHESHIHPFAISACGHTHTPDLVRVQFVQKSS